MNVLKEVVDKNWCVGCGMCAAVCPKKRLEIRWNAYGEYNPMEVEGTTDCAEGCSLCYQVCPAHGKTENETEIGYKWYGENEDIHHTDETGHYLAAYVGYAPDSKIRWNGASGGVLTQVLCDLLERDEIDYAVTVSPNPDSDKLFKFIVVSTSDEVRVCSKSVYYPVETSEVINHILENDGRYAIVGLPCVCKAIRLAQSNNKLLTDRIRFVLGLVCAGQQVNANFTQHLSKMKRDTKGLIQVTHREKQKNMRPKEYITKFKYSDGKCFDVFWMDGIWNLWATRIFRLAGCRYCDDAFAECADAAFADAWLPEYETCSEGTSIVVVRSAILNDFFSKNLEPLPISGAIQSQNVNKKRSSLNALLLWHKLYGKNVPNMRCFEVSFSLWNFFKIISMDGRYNAARKNFSEGKRFDSFRLSLFPYVLMQRFGSLLQRIKKGVK